MKTTTESSTYELDNFICNWCGKDVMMKPNLNEDMDYISFHGPGNAELLQLCRSCFITAYQGVMFAKEVVTDCQINGATVGKRIYVAVERLSQENELVNALIWPSTPLSEHARFARRNSVTYRVSQDC